MAHPVKQNDWSDYMIFDKTNIKEQVNYILNELSKAIDAIYTAPNLLTINKILENMRIDITNLIYLNEVRDKYKAKTADNADNEKLHSDPFLSKFQEPWPEDKVSDNLDEVLKENHKKKISANQEKNVDIKQTKEMKDQHTEHTVNINEKKTEAINGDAIKEGYHPEKPIDRNDKLIEVSKNLTVDSTDVSELDRLVAQLLEDNEKN